MIVTRYMWGWWGTKVSSFHLKFCSAGSPKTNSIDRGGTQCVRPPNPLPSFPDLVVLISLPPGNNRIACIGASSSLLGSISADRSPWALSDVGWSTINAIAGAQTLRVVADLHISHAVGIVIIAAVTLLYVPNRKYSFQRTHFSLGSVQSRHRRIQVHTLL